MNILTKVVLFSGVLFREQPSEPFREELIESAVHEPSSDRGWWSAGHKEVFLIGLLRCRNDRCTFRGERVFSRLGIISQKVAVLLM